MAKKKQISLSWPAQLSDFSKDMVQENFSRGKLKVFYKGETQDHRFFSDSFANDLIKTLPYTPVVSYYDEEKEDFVGHATEQQILGIIDPCKECSFETAEDGNVWCVCDVVLYTERPDKVGDLAKKIMGHKQSLELDPTSVQYKINYDERKHFKNIEFTAGRFVGVSVLGNDQQPAFAGSTFFSYDEKFENKMKLLCEYCKIDHSVSKEERGGNEMNTKDFMTLSWGEISTKVAEAISNEYRDEACCQLVDMFDDCAIVRLYYWTEEITKLLKINYTCDEAGVVILTDVVEVRVTYEPIVSDPIVEKVGVENTIEVAETAEMTESIEILEVSDESDEIVDVVDETADVSNAEVTNTERGISNDSISQETDASPAAFTDSEKAELETLKREKKIALLDSYKEVLNDEEYNNFLGSIDSFTDNSLELELLKAYKASKDKEPKTQRVFAFAPFLNQENVKKDSLEDYLKKFL